MAKKFPIEYYPIAVEDLYSIGGYIKKNDPMAAIKMIDTIEGSIGRLESFPEIGAIPKDIRLKQTGYRMLIIGDYLAFYVIEKETVKVRRILHGSRAYSFLL